MKEKSLLFMSLLPFRPTPTCLDRRAVADAGLLYLQRGYHGCLVSQMVLARPKLLRKERLGKRLEPAAGKKKRGEIVSQSAK